MSRLSEWRGASFDTYSHLRKIEISPQFRKLRSKALLCFASFGITHKAQPRLLYCSYFNRGCQLILGREGKSSRWTRVCKHFSSTMSDSFSRMRQWHGRPARVLGMEASRLMDWQWHGRPARVLSMEASHLMDWQWHGRDARVLSMEASHLMDWQWHGRPARVLGIEASHLLDWQWQGEFTGGTPVPRASR